jgi:hypothetical protein
VVSDANDQNPRQFVQARAQFLAPPPRPRCAPRTSARARAFGSFAPPAARGCRSLPDGVISAHDFGQRNLLTDPQYRSSVVARFAAGADISGITVHVRGAGIGSGYTATQLTGLRLLWDELVTSHGGTLAEFTADLSS